MQFFLACGPPKENEIRVITLNQASNELIELFIESNGYDKNEIILILSENRISSNQTEIVLRSEFIWNGNDYEPCSTDAESIAIINGVKVYLYGDISSFYLKNEGYFDNSSLLQNCDKYVPTTSTPPIWTITIEDGKVERIENEFCCINRGIREKLENCSSRIFDEK